MRLLSVLRDAASTVAAAAMDAAASSVERLLRWGVDNGADTQLLRAKGRGFEVNAVVQAGQVSCMSPL